MSTKAFTLVETLVAITVMTIATLAPFAAVQQVMRASNLSHDQLVASSLAQEAVEYVRFVRYTNWLKSEENEGGTGEYEPLKGLNGTSGPNCLGTNTCTIDARKAPYSGSTLQGAAYCTASGANPCARLYRTAEGLYTQDASETDGTANTQTEFLRTVSVDESTEGDGYVTVTVRVTWTDRGTHEIELEENLYNWL
ncbi:MAG: type II secretion system protein [Candidatus Pacebacteria bacterium]|nr:type II secretion system protein [Candidatus Paceibacterota bacterium]MBP9840222.1 type II secretion system protein [Candidatus Paceibacterota bacterium]